MNATAKPVGPPVEILIAEDSPTQAQQLQHAGVLLRQLGDYADAVRNRELERFFSSCPDLTDAQREAVGHLVHRLQNQYLHHPRTALRSAAKASETAEDPHPLLSAVRHLFRLGDGPAHHES